MTCEALLLGLLQITLFLAPILLGQLNVFWQIPVGCLLFLAIPCWSGVLASRRTQDRLRATRAGCWTAVVALVLLLPIPWIIATIWGDISIRLCEEQQLQQPVHSPYACSGAGIIAAALPSIFYEFFVFYIVAGFLLA